MFRSMFQQRKVVVLKANVQHTKYLFGNLEDLKKSTLFLIEQNRTGDCLCAVNDAQLVDVDYRDVEKVV